MNNNLTLLFRSNELDADRTMLVIEAVLANDTNLSTGRQRREYRRLHPNMVAMARAVIKEFTSRTGLFHIDHPAWQLGLDMTAAGPSYHVVEDDFDHVCADQDLIYQGHYVTADRGTSHMCSICSKMWDKIGNEYTEIKSD